MSVSVNTLRGGTRLVFDSVEGITTAVERMHEVIARRPLPLSRQPDVPRRAHGLIASAVYSSIRGVNGALRQAVDSAYGLVPEVDTIGSLSEPEIRGIAALNGAIGDHLEASGNALALRLCHCPGDDCTRRNRGFS